jgi:hypothetical protein
MAGVLRSLLSIRCFSPLLTGCIGLKWHPVYIIIEFIGYQLRARPVSGVSHPGNLEFGYGKDKSL